MTTNDFVTHLVVASVTMLIAVYTAMAVGFNAYSALFILVPVAIVLLALLGRKFPEINKW